MEPRQHFVENLKPRRFEDPVTAQRVLGAFSKMHNEDYLAGAEAALREIDTANLRFSNNVLTDELVANIVGVLEGIGILGLPKIYVNKTFEYAVNSKAYMQNPSVDGLLVEHWEGMDILLHVMSVIFAQYFDIENDLYCFQVGQAKETLNIHQEKLSVFEHNVIELAEFFHRSKKASFSTGIFGKSDFRTFQEVLYPTFYLSSMTFILAHEIGHHLLGHTGFDFSQFEKVLLPSETSDLGGRTREHAFEFGADAFATKVLNRLAGTKDYYSIYAAYLAPSLTLKSLQLLQGDIETPSHPKLSERCHRAEGLVDSYADPRLDRVSLSSFLEVLREISGGRI